MAEIELLNISKNFGEKVVFKDINIVIEEGTMISLLGPSGCGKTTLLKIIAGLEEVTKGRILINGKDVTDTGANKRNAIIVFQDYRLFPHMTVYENIEFGLKVRNIDKNTRTKQVKEILDLTQLTGLENSYPSRISGGQKQRTALARALVVKPGVLLLDEPFSNLDTALRESMREFVLKLHKELGFTAVLVTHDKEEAFMMSDRVVVLINGEIQQYDKPENIYMSPRTRLLAEFISEANFIKGNIKNGFFESSLSRLAVEIMNNVGPDKRAGAKDKTEAKEREDTQLADKADAQLMIRYDQIGLTRDDTGIRCEIIDKRFGGRDIYYKVKIEENLVLTLVSQNNNFNVTEKVFLLLKDCKFNVY